MPRKRRQEKPRYSTHELRMLLENPFAELDEPWKDPTFDMGATKRLWREIREEVIEKWARQYPGKRPWCFYHFEPNLPPWRNGVEEDVYLRRAKLLLPTEEGRVKTRLAERKEKHSRR